MKILVSMVCLAMASILPGTAQAAQAQVELKQPMSGLIDRQRIPTGAYAPIVNRFVIRVNWSDLQPDQEPGTDHGSTLDTTAIDQALSAPSAAGMAVRLRVYGGIHAPEWAKQLGGSQPIPWYAEGAQIGTIGRFWTSQYATAYQDLQNKLAAQYDDDSRVLDVVIARCTTEFAEPYIRQTGQLQLNQSGLAAAGYTGAADDQCHREEIEAHQVWQQTRSYLAFNPYQRIHEGTWTASVDNAFTMQMIDHCRTVLGARCVLGNNSLRPGRPQNYLTMWAYIAAKGGPISFQTAPAAEMCDGQDPCPAATWNETLDMAVGYGANAVELPIGTTGYTTWSVADVPPDHGLAYYDDLLEQAAP